MATSVAIRKEVSGKLTRNEIAAKHNYLVQHIQRLKGPEICAQSNLIKQLVHAREHEVGLKWEYDKWATAQRKVDDAKLEAYHLAVCIQNLKCECFREREERDIDAIAANKAAREYDKLNKEVNLKKRCTTNTTKDFDNVKPIRETVDERKEKLKKIKMKKFFQEKQLKKDEEEFAKVTSAIQRMQDYDRETARCAIHSMETQNQCMRDDIETLDEHYQFMMTKEVQYLRLIEAKTYHWNKYPNSGPYCTDITFNKYV